MHQLLNIHEWIQKMSQPNNNPEPRGEPLTLTQVRERTGASRSTVKRWRDLPPDKKLKSVKIDGFVRVYESQLQEFLDRHGL